MKRVTRTAALLTASVLTCFAFCGSTVTYAQSRLMGDQYTFSATNFQVDSGVVYDPIVDDRFNNPIDTGIPATVLTFDGIEETAMGMRVNERAVEFEGIPGGIFGVGYADEEVDITVWETAGEIVEFSFQTADGNYLSSNPEGPSLITLMNLDWANSVEGSKPTFEFFSEGGSFLEGGFYIYYSQDGVPATGYTTLIDTDLFVGEHPFDPSISEVVYIGFSQGDANETVATYESGMNLTNGTTELDKNNPDETSWLALAFAMDLPLNTILSQNGLHIGYLVQPPEAAATMRGDFNFDGVLDASDINALTQKSAAGTHEAAYDLTDDGLVNSADVTEWIRADDIFYSWVGDADLDGEFKSDDGIEVLAANTYEKDVPSVWTTGDFNGDGRTTAQDIIDALADNGYEQGPRTDVAAVPEPASASLALLGSLLLLAGRRRR